MGKTAKQHEKLKTFLFHINVLYNFTIINVKQHLSLHRSFLMALRSDALTKVSLIMTLKQQMRVCCHPLVRNYRVVPMGLCRYERGWKAEMWIEIFKSLKFGCNRLNFWRYLTNNFLKLLTNWINWYFILTF